jgi:hypothetical protein
MTQTPAPQPTPDDQRAQFEAQIQQHNKDVGQIILA